MLDGWTSQQLTWAYFAIGSVIGCAWAWREKSGESAGIAICIIPFIWPFALWVSFGAFLQYVGERWRRGGTR